MQPPTCKLWYISLSSIHSLYHFIRRDNFASSNTWYSIMRRMLQQQISRLPVGQVDSIGLKLKHQYVDQFRDGDVCELRLCHGAAYRHNATVRTKIKLIHSWTWRRLLATVEYGQLVVSQHHPLSLPHRLTSPATQSKYNNTHLSLLPFMLPICSAKQFFGLPVSGMLCHIIWKTQIRQKCTVMLSLSRLYFFAAKMWKIVAG